MRTSPLIRSASILLVLALLASCNLPTATPETQAESDGQDEASEQNAPSATPLPAEPSDTPLPSETPTPAAPTETPPPTATEGPNFGAASVYAVSHLSGDRLMVTLQVPGGIEGTYRSTSATSNQTCEILPEYPDRLYCTGPEPFENYSTVSATFRLFQEGQTQPVFETEFNIPARPAPTATITPTPTFMLILTLPPPIITISP